MEGRSIMVDRRDLPDDVVAGIHKVHAARHVAARVGDEEGGEPADVLISPRVAQISMMEFDRAGEAIAEGAAAVERLQGLQLALGLEGAG